jgi:hypothetical protein
MAQAITETRKPDLGSQYDLDGVYYPAEEERTAPLST